MRVVPFFFVVLFFVVGCGGGGGNETSGDRQPEAQTKVGQFKDANVAGLSYVSGGQSGVTDSEGRFTYEVGESVKFSVGSVTLGETEGKSVVTPVDLVKQGSSSSKLVLNMTRFLTSLDQDADLSNGITISQDIQTRAQNWELEFNSDKFDQELESIRSDLEEEYESFSDFSDETTSRAHLEATIRCSYSGGYTGKYRGSDQGNFGILVDALGGGASGIAYSTRYDEYTTLTSEETISYDQNVAFLSGHTGDKGTKFDGRFTSVDAVQGQWEDTSDPNIRGTFSGTRIGGDQYAVYRATGDWHSNNYEDYGLFTFDINNSGRITGIAYSIADDIFEDLTGTLSGDTLSGTTSETGTKITGTLNKETGVLSGTFDNKLEGSSGSFRGNGCRLN